ncbi:MAG: type II toxin-antitoxin system death-on-curing family toxin [Megasphaera sp.]|uniref:type II toxin-antitoxin system death-on-curing family toxin n=1 Tax=Megasphaera sp. TaxID=2023260 RepID=UPI003F082B62
MAMEKHDYIIQVSGGLPGIVPGNQQHLESLLTFVQNDLYYPSFIEKLAFLTYTIAKDHIFVDGNKRSAIAIGAYFMAINDYDDLIPRYMTEMENYVVWAMENKIDREDLIEKIEFIILDVEESEEFTLRIIKKLS